MGKRKHRPKRGSLAYMPRVRAPRPIAHVRAWPADTSPRLQGFAGYKAGMTQAFVIDDREGSPTAGQEIAVPATVIDSPPMIVCAARLYGQTSRGFNTLTEVWAEKLPEDLARVLSVPKERDFEKAIRDAEGLVKEGKAADVRVIACTQPRLSSVPKKKPDLIEVGVGGTNLEERWNFCRDLLGKQVSVSETFRAGEYADAVAITKGKGFQGPVKRWGIKILPRKSDEGRRQVGALGPWSPPRIMWSVPAAGQMGYHQRTEFNKRILKVGTEGKEVTPAGGFLRYGAIAGDYVLVAGSVPGPTKRIVQLRRAIRARGPFTVPSITHLSTRSQQGD